MKLIHLVRNNLTLVFVCENYRENNRRCCTTRPVILHPIGGQKLKRKLECLLRKNDHFNNRRDQFILPEHISEEEFTVMFPNSIVLVRNESTNDVECMFAKKSVEKETGSSDLSTINVQSHAKRDGN